MAVFVEFDRIRTTIEERDNQKWKGLGGFRKMFEKGERYLPKGK